MKNLILGIFICFLSASLSAQTPKINYKSHSGSFNTFNLASKSFGLPAHMYPVKIQKIEEQTIKTKPIQSFETVVSPLKKIKLSTPIDKKTLKKQQKKAKKEAKRKAKEKRKKKKANKNKSVSQASLIKQNTSNNSFFQFLLVSLGLIILVIAGLPTNKK